MGTILKNKRLFAILFWIWVALILYFSLTPNSPKLKIEIDEKSFRLDYLFHFLVYFGMTFLYYCWKTDHYSEIKTLNLISFILISVVVSGILEYIQKYIPNRSFNPIDFISNTAGIVIGIVFLNLFLNKLKS